MTIQEIIESIDYCLKCDNDRIPTTQEDLQTIKEALEKQIPKKPTAHKVDVPKIKVGNGFFGKGTTVYRCPCCNELISRICDCCYNCGQAIDWSKKGKTKGA